ncbi:MAG: hypothetical protein EOP49_04175 [Sphingobacteriales bacterium]|nr:MAG: hypothetical protein EOP49_04175 [Sphingobacteriales bacterium]
MLRKVIAFITGILIAMVVIMGAESIKDRLYPLPTHADPANYQVQSQYISELPVSALMIILTGWVLGSLFCGLSIGVISRSSERTPSYIAGVFLTATAIVNLFLYPHPMWFIILGVAVFIPFTLLGHILAPKPRSSKKLVTEQHYS